MTEVLWLPASGFWLCSSELEGKLLACHPAFRLADEVFDGFVQSRAEGVEVTEDSVGVDHDDGREAADMVPGCDRALARIAVIPVGPGDSLYLHHLECSGLIGFAVHSQQGEGTALETFGQFALVGNLTHARAAPGAPENEHNDLAAKV